MNEEKIIQAFEVIKQVCEQSQGNFHYHQQVQSALKTVADELNRAMDGRQDVNNATQQEAQ